jgi:VWFA-related protein
MISILRVVFAAAFAAAAGFAQTPDVPPARSFGESVEVHLVNVEVWVTDGAGRPVTRLSVDDFTVLEDGQPVTVSYFDEVRGVGVPDLTARLERLPKEGTAPSAGEGASSPPAAPAPGYLILYFDELLLGPTGRADLVRDLRSFVESQFVAPERVLILRHDGDLTAEAALGSSPAELDAALTRLAGASTRGLLVQAEERDAIRLAVEEWERLTTLGGAPPSTQQPIDPCDFFAEQGLRKFQDYVRATRVRVSESLAQLDRAASYVAGLPGLKTLIFVSDGMTMTPGSNLVSFVQTMCPDRQGARDLDYSLGLADGFRRLTRHANANQVTIYTIQALGLAQGSNLSTADQRGVNNTIRGLARYDTETRVAARQGLSFLAEETGGRAILNQNTFEDELEQIASEMSGYYSLAYAPPHGGDGLEHRIEVKVRGRNRVRHRPGYRDKAPDQRMAERLESALYLNVMANPLEVRLGAGRIEEAEDRKLSVALHVMVPVDKLTFLPQGVGAVARVKIQAMAQNERRTRTGFQQKYFEVERPATEAPNQLVDLTVTLDLAKGVHVVAFGVRDEATQETSVVSTGLDLRAERSAGGK